MIVSASIRSLLRRRSRTALAVAGIAVSAALLIDMTMLASGLTKSFGELTRAQGYPLRITPRGTLPFDSEAGLQEAGTLRQRISSVDGVTSVAPVLGAQLYPVIDDSLGTPAFATGVDPEAQMLYLLLEGRDPSAGEIVVSGPLATAFSLSPGDSLLLTAEVDAALGRARSSSFHYVSGIADFIYDYAGQRSLALPLEELQALTGRADEVSLFAVAIDPGQDEDTVADVIASLSTSISVYSTRELMAAMDARLAYFRQLSTILGAIALGVGALLVGTIVTIGVRERFGEIATLRAIGVPGRRLHFSIVAQGLALTLTGCAVGVPLGLWMAGRLDRILLAFPGIPARVSFFVLDATSVGIALAMIVAVGGFAGILPGSRALGMPLGQALREEAD